MYHTSSLHANKRSTGIVLCAALLATLWLAQASAAQAAGTLEQIRKSGKLTIGYLADAQPYSYTDESGKVTGYAIALCQKVADTVKSELKLDKLAVDFVPVSADSRSSALEQSKIDLLCGDVPTLSKRKSIDFSIAVFASGKGVIVRDDAPARLVQALSGRESIEQPYWRGAQGQAPERKTFAVIAGTTLERVLIERMKELRIAVDVVTVKDMQEGLKQVHEGRAAAFFGDRALLLAAAKRSPAGDKIVVIDRIFRREPVALGLRRTDPDFRLLVDTALSRLYRSSEITTLYTTYFGKPEQGALTFFELSALPE
jgi:ABC-type amino acid transport substrate-binding protein